MTNTRTELSFFVDPAKYAALKQINLHQEYGAAEAARLIGVGINALRAAKNGGEIEYIAYGETRCKFLGVDLVKWKLNKRTKSAITTSPKADTVIGVELGTMNKPSKESLQACARQILSPQSSR